jgi:ubiquinol-cytochrome c reductase cytochrome c1 subunit
MKVLLLIFLFLMPSFCILASGNDTEMPKHEWSFGGIIGTFDRSSIQRGYKVYREVCSRCHSMSILYYRDLIDIGFSAEIAFTSSAEKPISIKSL